VTLQGDEHTIRSVLDTLTSCCMQMAELLQSGQGGGDMAAANQLTSLLKKSRKPAALPTADQVEFWKSPEKAGWMYSQGEHIKTWRKRWFVLKQGFLFRFASQDVVPASKPRGIVDLSQVTDVSDGSELTGRPLSIKLSTATGGSKCYLTESETAQVEWISALEGAVGRILKIVAGLDDEDEKPASDRKRGMGSARSMEEQLRQTFGSASKSFGRSENGGGGGGSSSSSSKRAQPAPKTINIINYQGERAPDAPMMPDTRSSGGWGPPLGYNAGPASSDEVRPGGGAGPYVNIEYGTIAGAQEAPSDAYAPAGGPSGYANAPGGGTGFSGMYGGSAQYTSYNTQPGQGYPTPATQASTGYEAPAPAAQYDAYVSSGYAPQPTYPQAQPQQYYHGQPEPMQAPQNSVSAVPTLLDSVTVPPGPPPAPSSPWQVHHTQDGRPYYYNTATGITAWSIPAEG
jgi:hypothetical protein